MNRLAQSSHLNHQCTIVNVGLHVLHTDTHTQLTHDHGPAVVFCPNVVELNECDKVAAKTTPETILDAHFRTRFFADFCQTVQETANAARLSKDKYYTVAVFTATFACWHLPLP